MWSPRPLFTTIAPSPTEPAMIARMFQFSARTAERGVSTLVTTIRVAPATAISSIGARPNDPASDDRSQDRQRDPCFAGLRSLAGHLLPQPDQRMVGQRIGRTGGDKAHLTRPRGCCRAAVWWSARRSPEHLRLPPVRERSPARRWRWTPVESLSERARNVGWPIASGPRPRWPGRSRHRRSPGRCRRRPIRPSAGFPPVRIRAWCDAEFRRGSARPRWPSARPGSPRAKTDHVRVTVGSGRAASAVRR